VGSGLLFRVRSEASVPRRFGYIIVAVAAVLGAGALLLPLPEQIEVKQEEAAPATRTPRPPTPPAVPSRPARKPGAAPPPSPPPAAKAPPAAPPFPMQDTTKTRTLVQPTPKKE